MRQIKTKNQHNQQQHRKQHHLSLHQNQLQEQNQPQQGASNENETRSTFSRKNTVPEQALEQEEEYDERSLQYDGRSLQYDENEDSHDVDDYYDDGNSEDGVLQQVTIEEDVDADVEKDILLDDTMTMIPVAAEEEQELLLKRHKNDTNDAFDQPMTTSIHNPTQSSSSSSEQLQKQRQQQPQSDQHHDWLHEATATISDCSNSHYPLGSLCNDDIETIYGLMYAWTKRRSLHAALQVELLLKRVVQEMQYNHNTKNSDNNNNMIQVTSKMYTYVIDAWGKSAAVGSAHRAQHIHDAMVALYKETKNPYLAPSTTSYNALLNAWSKSVPVDPRSNNITAKSINKNNSNANNESTKNNTKNITSAPTDAAALFADKNDNDPLHRAELVFNEMLQTMNEALEEHRKQIIQQQKHNVRKTMISTTTSNISASSSNDNMDQNDYSRGRRQRQLPNVDDADEELRNWDNTDHGAAFDIDASNNDDDDDDDDCDNNNYISVKPDAITFGTLIDMYAKYGCVVIRTTSKSRSSTSSTSNARLPGRYVQRCEELFSMMDEMNIKKTSYIYSTIQNIYAKSGIKDAPEKAMNLLQQMKAIYKNSGDVYIKPNAINYNAVLNALSRAPSKENTKKAIEVLRRMELPVSEGGYDVEPDRLSYAVTILCCARSPDLVYAAKTAEELLLQMERRAQYEAQRRAVLSSAAPAAVTLDVECYNVVLTALSRCKQPDAPDRAIHVVHRMDQLVRDGQEQVRPNIRSWNAVLNSFARASGSSYDRDYAQKAERILNRLIKFHESGVPNIKPNAFTYAAVLSAYQKSNDPDAAHRADDIVRRMEQQFELGQIDTAPDTYHYTILCGTWAKSNRKQASERVLQILVHMIEKDKAGYPDVKPNTRTYNAVLDCLSRSNDQDRAEQLLFYMLQKLKDGDEYAKPDSFSFNCVIQAYTKSSRPGSGKQAERILERLLEYNEQENCRVRPDARSFTHIIQYYTKKSQDPDAMYRANYILMQMVNYFKAGQKDLLPSSFVFTSVMDSYSYRGHPDSGKNADRLLNQMKQLVREFGVSKLFINTAVMNSVIFAWSTSGEDCSGRTAEIYLDEMERSYEKGLIHLQPDTKTYIHVLSAWSKASSADKAQRAWRILHRMERQCNAGNTKVVLDERAYSLVINTCAFSKFGVEAEREAFMIAVTVMDKILMTETHCPFSLTFGWFIQACGRLRIDEEEKSHQIERAFTACCERGLVNDFVLHRLKGAASDALYQRLVNIVGQDQIDSIRHGVQCSHLPHEWKRNVLSKKQRFARER